MKKYKNVVMPVKDENEYKISSTLEKMKKKKFISFCHWNGNFEKDSAVNKVFKEVEGMPVK